MFAVDKLLHFTGCAALMLFTALLTGSWPGAAAFTLLVGAGKEAWDALREGGSGWSWGDLAADVAGIVAGAVLATILSLCYLLLL